MNSVVIGAISAGTEQIVFNVFDPDAELSEGVLQAVVVGGIFGAITGGIGYEEYAQYHFDLKNDKRMLHVQVYRLPSGRYECNA